MTATEIALLGLAAWLLGAGVGGWYSLRVYQKHAAILRKLILKKFNGYRLMLAVKSVRQATWRLFVVAEAILIGLIVALLPASNGRGLFVMVGLLAIIWTVAWSAVDQDRYLDRILDYPMLPKEDET